MLENTDIEKVQEMLKGIFTVVEITPVLDGLFIQHPFSNSPMVNTMDKGIVNILDSDENYNAWRDTIFTIIDKKKTVSGLFALIDKNWRLTALKFSKDYMSLKDFSETLANAWIMAENPNDDVNVNITTLIHWFKQANKHILMDDEDYAIWSDLPDELTLYRGISRLHNPKGLSWTRNIKTAEWFKNRFESSDCYMLKAVVKKEDMICYLNSRDEDEIVVDTRHIISERID